MQICKCRHFCHSALDYRYILPTIIGQLNYQLYILHELCCIYNPLCMCPLSLNGHDTSGCVFSLSLSESQSSYIPPSANPPSSLLFCCHPLLCVAHTLISFTNLSLPLSLLLSQFHLLFLDWTWHGISFWKLGKAHPWDSHALFIF